MRQRKTISLSEEGPEITIIELTPEQILGMLSDFSGDFNATTFLLTAKKFWDGCIDYPLEKMKTRPFSEWKKVYEAFKEVNSPLFESWEVMKKFALVKSILQKITEYLSQTLENNLSSQFADSQEQDTETHGAMAMVSSR